MFFSPDLFNILAEMVMRKNLDEFQDGLQIKERMVTNLRYADDIILLAMHFGYPQNGDSFITYHTRTQGPCEVPGGKYTTKHEEVRGNMGGGLK